ncbi:MAG: hypothetical protein RLN90_13035 [Balneolaceae bacterium]
MKFQVFKLSLFILLVLTFSNGYAQTESDTVKQNPTVIITMQNGDEFKGLIISQNNDRIILKTINGEISLIAANVKSIEEYTYSGKFDFENPHDTRYFFGPSAIPIKKGKRYYQNVLVTTNFFNYGITEKISVGGGFEFISTIQGEPIWFLTPKVGYQLSETVYVGGGFIMAGASSEGTATLGYGVFTLGKSESNLSLSVGYGIADGEVTESPVIVVSGTHRTSNSITLLSENYFLPEANYFGIHGIRILSNKNAFDIGAIVIPEIIEYVPALPYVGYVRVF